MYSCAYASLVAVKGQGAHYFGVRARHTGARAAEEAGGLYALLLQDLRRSTGVGDLIRSGVRRRRLGQDIARAEAGHLHLAGLSGSPVCQGQDAGCGSNGEEV